VYLLTIIVCSVNIGELADHLCLFCCQQVHQYQQNKQLWLASPPISTEQTMMVSKSTNINRTNNDGQQVHQYQQNKQ
jgi:hypothetical protein